MDQVIPSFEVSCWTVDVDRGEYGHYTIKDNTCKRKLKYDVVSEKYVVSLKKHQVGD